MALLRKAVELMSFDGGVTFDEPMAEHTSLQVGGPAEVYLVPDTIDDLKKTIALAQKTESPVFVLGGGANILVADSGIPGIVIDMRQFDEHVVSDGLFVGGAGLAISDASLEAANNELSGMEFLYSMPGSVGGSVWMNARCYGKSVCDIIEYVDTLDKTDGLRTDRGRDTR